MKRYIVKKNDKYAIRQVQFGFWTTYVDLTNPSVAWFLDDNNTERDCWSTSLTFVDEIAHDLDSRNKMVIIKEIK